MKRNRPRRFAEGGSDRYKDRYDRKVADIESDYTKALKAGKNADIAKAKYNQRMADAKDDLAKWTKADRSETSAAEKAAEAALSAARRSDGASMRETPVIQPLGTKLDVAPIGRIPMLNLPELKRKAAPAKAAPAKAASVPDNEDIVVTGRRMRDDLNSLYGRDYAAAIRRAQQNRTSNVVNQNTLQQRPSTPPLIGSDPAGRAARLASMRLKAEAPGASRMDKDAYRFALESDQYKKGGVAKKKPTAKKAVASVKRYAKGGSVDGCAIRGRTRAPMKKGGR